MIEILVKHQWDYFDNFSANAYNIYDCSYGFYKELHSETLKLESEKLEKSLFEAEIQSKSEKADLEMKVDKLWFQTVTEDLQALIDDLLNKLLTLVCHNPPVNLDNYVMENNTDNCMAHYTSLTSQFI